MSYGYWPTWWRGLVRSLYRRQGRVLLTRYWQASTRGAG